MSDICTGIRLSADELAHLSGGVWYSVLCGTTGLSLCWPDVLSTSELVQC